jgi:hypothetical protein
MGMRNSDPNFSRLVNLHAQAGELIAIFVTMVNRTKAPN